MKTTMKTPFDYAKWPTFSYGNAHPPIKYASGIGAWTAWISAGGQHDAVIVQAGNKEDALALRKHILKGMPATGTDVPTYATTGEIAEAAQRYCKGSDDNIEIDDYDVLASHADNGVWVAAWVWVPKEGG